MGLCDSGIILNMCPVNERRRYIVTSSLIGWAHTQNEAFSLSGGYSNHSSTVLHQVCLMYITDIYLSLQPISWWRHMTILVCVKSPATPLFVQQLALADKENTKCLYYWQFPSGIHKWLVDSPHKGPVMQKNFFYIMKLNFSHFPIVTLTQGWNKAFLETAQKIKHSFQTNMYVTQTLLDFLLLPENCTNTAKTTA